jgi:hypothetical protein
MSMDLLNYMEVATGVMQHQYGATAGVIVALASDGTMKCTKFGLDDVEVVPELELLPSASTTEQGGDDGEAGEGDDA